MVEKVVGCEGCSLVNSCKIPQEAGAEASKSHDWVSAAFKCDVTKRSITIFSGPVKSDSRDEVGEQKL
jgi:hypothetical protein